MRFQAKMRLLKENHGLNWKDDMQKSNLIYNEHINNINLRNQREIPPNDNNLADTINPCARFK